MGGPRGAQARVTFYLSVFVGHKTKRKRNEGSTSYPSFQPWSPGFVLAPSWRYGVAVGVSDTAPGRTCMMCTEAGGLARARAHDLRGLERRQRPEEQRATCVSPPQNNGWKHGHTVWTDGLTHVSQDVVIMAGRRIQHLYDHRVIPLGLRVAATARVIRT
jgi:hypothetical protein